MYYFIACSQPITLGPLSGVQAPPPQTAAATYQMMPAQQQMAQMAQGQNARPQMQPSPQVAATAATMQSGYQIRPLYHMTPQGIAATAATPPQQWGNIMEQQQMAQPAMIQQEVVDMKNFTPQQFQQEMQNGMIGM